MTRKRTRESLAHMLCEPCPTCDGKRPGQDRAQRLLRRSCARSCARRGSSTRRNSAWWRRPHVVEMLLDEENQHLAGLCDFIGKPISLHGRARDGAGPVRHRLALAAVQRMAGWPAGARCGTALFCSRAYEAVERHRAARASRARRCGHAPSRRCGRHAGWSRGGGPRSASCGPAPSRCSASCTMPLGFGVERRAWLRRAAPMSARSCRARARSPGAAAGRPTTGSR